VVRWGASAAWLHKTLGGAALAAALLPFQAAEAQEESLEHAVKATYLYQFAPFIEWPGGPTSAPLELCVVGDDPFGPLLDRAVSGQRIGGRLVELRRLEVAQSDDGCQILYIGGSAQQSAAEALQATRGAPVLTVTDAAQGPGPKGIIHFVILDNRVRFEIDAEAAAANGLKISSKLLDLAVNVRRRS
jgi:hypothetical protein